MRIGIILAILVSSIALDRFTKNFFQTQSAESGLSLIPNVLALTTHQNYGVVANIPIPRVVIILLTIIALCILTGLLIRAIRQNAKAQYITLTLAIAGAVGNLWDRIAWGFVFDWILLFGRSVINLADMFIALGLLGYALTLRSPARAIDEISKTP